MHEELKPAAHLRRPQAPSRTPSGTNLALDYRLRRGDFDKAFRRGRAQVREHEFPHPEGAASVVRAVRLASATTRTPNVTFYNSTQGPSFVRTEMARLLGWPENKVRDQGAVLGFGLRLQALRQARSAGARAVDDRAQAGEGRPTPSRRCSTRSPAIPRTFRIKSGVDKNGRIVARKCEVFWNGGAYADIGPRVTQSGPDRSRTLRHRQRLDQFLRALHQCHAGRRATRLRRPAAGVGL